jgi:predicted lysophospholipase L1 biosynthesis ABC-type transport system permease subunit
VFVFRPNVLDAAPQMFVAPLKGPSDPPARAFPARSRRALPTCPSSISEVLRDDPRRHVEVTFAITVVGGLVLFSGLIRSARSR